MCRCAAYAWPHRPGGALCRWPEAPLERSPTPAGTRKPRRRDRKLEAVRGLAKRYAKVIAEDEAQEAPPMQQPPAAVPAFLLALLSAPVDPVQISEREARCLADARKHVADGFVSAVHRDGDRWCAGVPKQHRAALLAALERMAAEPSSPATAANLKRAPDAPLGWRFYFARWRVHGTYDPHENELCLLLAVPSRGRRPRLRSGDDDGDNENQATAAARG